MNFYITKIFGLTLSFTVLFYFKYNMEASEFAGFAKYTRYSELFLILFALGLDKKLFKEVTSDLYLRSITTSLIVFSLALLFALLFSLKFLFVLAIIGGFLKLSIRYRSIHELSNGSKIKAALFENFLIPISLLLGFAFFNSLKEILLFSLLIVSVVFIPYLNKAFKGLINFRLNILDMHILLSSVIGYFISKSDAILLDVMGAKSETIANIFFFFSVFAIINFVLVFQFQSDLSLYNDLEDGDRLKLFLEKRRKRVVLLLGSVVFVPVIILYYTHWVFIVYFIATVYSIAMSYTGHVLVMCGLADKLVKIQLLSLLIIGLSSSVIYVLNLDHYYVVLSFSGSILVENYLKNYYVVDNYSRLTT